MSHKKEQRTISRRDFVRGMGLAALGLASQSLLAGCGQTTPPTPTVAPTAPQPTRVPPTAVPPTPVPPTPVPTPTEAGLSGLIGKLEGPEIITDPTNFPKAFNEAPQLAQLVAAGKLPKVADRIGSDPLVIKPLREIGNYGGTWRRGFTGTSDKHNGYRAGSGLDTLLFRDYSCQTVVPNIPRTMRSRMMDG